MTSSSTTTPHIAHTLLLHAHPPDLASSIFTEKVLHKPLRLRGTSPNPTSHDARAQRRLQRLRKKEKEKEKEKALSKAERKAKPLSAKQKRVSGIYDIPPRARKYDVYISLHRMWVGYMWEVLGLRGGNGDGNGNGNGNGNGKGGGEGVVMGGGKAAYVTAQSAGKVLAAADFHGAEVMVVRSRCVGMVGLAGIVVRDTKFTFQVITKGNQLKSMCSPCLSGELCFDRGC